MIRVRVGSLSEALRAAEALQLVDSMIQRTAAGRVVRPLTRAATAPKVTGEVV